MGLVHGRKLLALFATIAFSAALIAACGEVEDPRRVERVSPPAVIQPDGAEAESRDPQLYDPPVANGEPMPPAEEAGGVPPYPGATVYLRNRKPQPVRRLEAFTFDTWDSVTEYYRVQLPTWTYRQAGDMAIFEKEPDQASVSIAPWDYQDLPDDAPEVLRRARTSIGAAWR